MFGALDVPPRHMSWVVNVGRRLDTTLNNKSGENVMRAPQKARTHFMTNTAGRFGENWGRYGVGVSSGCEKESDGVGWCKLEVVARGVGRAGAGRRRMGSLLWNWCEIGVVQMLVKMDVVVMRFPWRAVDVQNVEHIVRQNC